MEEIEKLGYRKYIFCKFKKNGLLPTSVWRKISYLLRIEMRRNHLCSINLHTHCYHILLDSSRILFLESQCVNKQYSYCLDYCLSRFCPHFRITDIFLLLRQIGEGGKTHQGCPIETDEQKRYKEHRIIKRPLNERWQSLRKSLMISINLLSWDKNQFFMKLNQDYAFCFSPDPQQPSCSPFFFSKLPLCSFIFNSSQLSWDSLNLRAASEACFEIMRVPYL